MIVLPRLILLSYMITEEHTEDHVIFKGYSLKSLASSFQAKIEIFENFKVGNTQFLSIQLIYDV